MSKVNLTQRAFGTQLGIELAFTPLIGALLASIGGLRMWPSIALVFGLLVPKYVLVWGIVRRQLGPADAVLRTAEEGQRIHESDLREADRRLQGAPETIGYNVAALTALTFLGIIALHHHFIAPSELRTLLVPTALILTVSLGVGGTAVYVLIHAWLTVDASGRLYLLGRTRGVNLARPRQSIGARLLLVGLGLVLMPSTLLTAAVISRESATAVEAATLEARSLSNELARAAVGEAGMAPLRKLAPRLEAGRMTLFSVGADGGFSSVGAPLPGWANRELLSQDADGAPRTAQQGSAVAATRLTDGSVVGSVVAPRTMNDGTLILLGSVLVMMVMFGAVGAGLLSRSLSVPLEQTALLVRRAAEVGDLSAMGALPVARMDEVGLVSENVNQMLDSMRAMAKLTAEVANGNLSLELGGEGELQNAFRRMVQQLREVVQEMLVTSAELAGAATEIFAASQEQEASTTTHSTGMTEVSQTMASLSQSAAHVASSVQGVLDNAERTLQNTDRMVARIDELTGRANRIGEILEVIRDIADRTDLLALNGSLEASRAGEAGVGFSLVAQEMRRLAERVTGSVKDIKSLVSEIRESGASTVVATEESKKLAEGTTQAARSITLVTQQQQSSTEQVAQHVRSMTDVGQQAAMAAVQTRSSAEGLKQQADRIAELVGRFQLT